MKASELREILDKHLNNGDDHEVLLVDVENGKIIGYAKSVTCDYATEEFTTDTGLSIQIGTYTLN